MLCPHGWRCLADLARPTHTAGESIWQDRNALRAATSRAQLPSPKILIFFGLPPTGVGAPGGYLLQVTIGSAPDNEAATRFCYICSTPAMRNVGIGLLIAVYVSVLWTSLAAACARAPTQLGPAIPAEYAATWPVALACVLALNGLALTLIPIRRGENWASWLSAVTLLILVSARIATDPCCLAVLDLNQHSCHVFMIFMSLGFVGLALAAPGRSKPGQSAV